MQILNKVTKMALLTAMLKVIGRVRKEFDLIPVLGLNTFNSMVFVNRKRRECIIHIKDRGAGYLFDARLLDTQLKLVLAGYNKGEELKPISFFVSLYNTPNVLKEVLSEL